MSLCPGLGVGRWTEAETDRWVGARVEEQMGDGVEKCPPCLVPPVPAGRAAQRGGQCQGTLSPPLGMSQLPPDNPR